MTKHLTATIAAGVAALGLAAAPAIGAEPLRNLPNPSDPRFDVAPGKLEHTVVIQKVEGSSAIPSHTKTSQWLTRDRAHVIVTDLRTGRVRAETVATRREVRTYDAESNTIRVERRKHPGGLPFNSFRFEQAVQRAYAEQGITRVVGERVVDGRRALVTRSVEGRWRSDEPSSVTTAVVDAEDYTLLERATAMPDGAFSQTQQFTVNRVLEASPENVGATMAMKPRGHARVVRRAR
jgi:hypothetical protein